MITLPTTPLPVLRKDPRLLLIYGQNKIGKTTILSLLPKCLIVETDPRGCEFLSAAYVQINSMLEFSEVNKAILSANKPYDFVCIDTLDNLDLWSEHEATRLYKSSPIGKTFQGDTLLDLPNRGGYYLYWEVFTKVLTIALNMADKVILTCHIRDKLIGQIAGQTEVFAKDINLTGKLCTKTTSTVDACGYLTRDRDSNLVISFKTHENVNCGCRAPHLAGQTFTMKGSAFDWSKIYPDYYGKLKAHPSDDREAWNDIMNPTKIKPITTK